MTKQGHTIINTLLDDYNEDLISLEDLRFEIERVSVEHRFGECNCRVCAYNRSVASNDLINRIGEYV